MEWTREAPAKVNLALDVLGKRADGYHDMRMVMQTISLCDTVTVRTRETGFHLRMKGFTLPQGKKTLEEQAAETFFRALGRSVPGLEVEIVKRTPAYAGMGGGSADVAALLRILRAAYAPELPDGELERMGAEVGSDMPFCIRGGTALAEGRGEVLTDVAPLPDCWFVICKPDFGIATPLLFARVDRVVPAERPDISGMIAALRAGKLDGVAGRLSNVFEDALPEEYREVFAVKEKLKHLGAMNALMSGSGPAVFGIFRERAQAEAAERVLKRTYQETWLAQPVKKFQ